MCEETDGNKHPVDWCLWKRDPERQGSGSWRGKDTTGLGRSRLGLDNYDGVQVMSGWESATDEALFNN